jgi:hypothetical protein
MTEPKQPAAGHRRRLLASTATLTLLFGASFAAPAMAMRPAIQDVVAIQSVPLAIADNNNNNNNQKPDVGFAMGAKPSELRSIDAELGLA